MEWTYVIAAVAAYLIGSLNGALVIGKIMGVDIRTKGSGNAGATNAVRILGKKTGYIVFLLDFIKGILAVLAAKLIFDENEASLAALFVVLGHVYPVYFGFKGGKGISTIVGVIAILDWRIFVFAAVWMIGMILITKIVSLSTLTGVLGVTILFAVLHWGNWILIAVSALLTVITFVKHRANIKRLLNGTENKFGKKKQEKSA
ncbi:MAG: glycerol-3-phosphate 1-O-acyltransferase PlsY [Clostridia bacterium]|nr:glycerol-3-phosphate 1-O-acyltransferase PlsY [Clostridia bacterium]